MKSKKISAIVIIAVSSAVCLLVAAGIVHANKRAEASYSATESADSIEEESTAPEAESVTPEAEPEMESVPEDASESAEAENDAGTQDGDIEPTDAEDDDYAYVLVTTGDEETVDGDELKRAERTVYAVNDSDEPQVIHRYVYTNGGTPYKSSYVIRYNPAQGISNKEITYLIEGNTGADVTAYRKQKVLPEYVVSYEDLSNLASLPTSVHVIRVPAETTSGTSKTIILTEDPEDVASNTTTVVEDKAATRVKEIDASSTSVKVSVKADDGSCSTNIIGASTDDVKDIHWYLTVKKGSAQLVETSNPFQPHLVMSDDCYADLYADVTFKDTMIVKSNIQYIRVDTNERRVSFSEEYVPAIDMFHLKADALAGFVE